MKHRFGARLKLRRQDQHLSQDTLAERSKIDRSYLGRIERGVVMPGPEIRARLLAALEIPPDDYGYLMALPPHDRAVAQLSAQEESLTPGQQLDRLFLFASGREQDMITEFVHLLNRIIMEGDEEE